MAGTMADVRAMRPGRPVASTTGQVEVLTVSLPPGSSLATTNSELNSNYSEAQSNLAKAQASGDQAAIDRAQIQVNLKQAQLNTFVQRQNAPSATLDEKNIVDPATRNANANTTTTTTAPAPVTEPNRDDRPAPANTTTQTAQVTTVKLVPADNLLHGYASYTYRLSLYVLSAKEYNDLISDSERKVDDFKNLLMSSGGGNQAHRAPYFKEDFYFDSMEISSLFGSGAAARNTNVTTIKFKVIEPYGITYLERLVKAVTEITQSNNYTDQPYLFTLDFWGYDDEALAPKKIDNCTRNLVVRIVNVTFQVTSKGTEYDFTAMPYGHTALNEGPATISANFEVSAKTVAEFFGDSKTPPAESTAAALKVNTPRDDRSSTPQAPAPGTVQASGSSASPKPAEINGSLSFVLNQNQRALQEKNEIEIADEYVFKIDKSIAEAGILSADDKDIKGVPMKTEIFKKYASAASKTTITYESDKRKIAVAAGTTLTNLINDIVLHSTYSLNQILSVDDEEAKNIKTEKPIQWLRIVPDVELLGFDKKRNMYAKRYIYNLLEFPVFGHNHEQMPQAPAPGAAKIYEYFYTGQNKDILDLKIEFNTLYMQYLTANRGIKAGSTPPTNIDKNPDKTDTTNPAGTVFPSQVAVSNSPALSSPSRASTNSNDLILNDVNNSLLSKPGVDMASIQLSIVGDPAYITQADIFYGEFTGQFSKSAILPDGSLNPYASDLFVLIRFNTPNDIDLDKGIYDFTDNGQAGITSSSFTGLYRVMNIESNLTGGKFTQNLSLLRMPEQSSNYVIESAARNKFVKQDVGPENIKKLIADNNKIYGGIASDLLDLASSFAPVTNLLNGRNLV